MFYKAKLINKWKHPIIFTTYWHIFGINISFITYYRILSNNKNALLNIEQYCNQNKYEFNRNYFLFDLFSHTKGQSIWKACYCFLTSSKNLTKLTILSIFSTKDSEFQSFFGRSDETIICFRDCLTLCSVKS